jgi:glycosyltransferase involved in cell wall biosynthesis
MDILFVTPWFPYPATNGARVRSSKLLAALAAAGHRCHLFAFEPPPASAPGPYPDLSSVSFTASWKSHRPGRLVSTLALLAPTPRYFRLVYQPELFEQIRQAVRERRADVVIAYEMAAGDYVARLTDGRVVKILDGCEPFAFQSTHATLRSLARIWKFKRFLRSMLNRFDAYIAVSDAELSWIRQEVAPRHAWGCTVPNGTDLADAYVGPVDGQRIIYTGSLTYRANLETVDYFLAEIWPAIRRAQPGATFVVTGERPDQETARRLEAVPGVSLAGLLADYQRFVSSSAVLAAPLLRGGGTRIKVLEAFALGCPVVATPKAVEGLQVSPGQDVLVAGTPAEFASAVISVMRDESLRRSLIDNGRRTATGYSWIRAQASFVEVTTRCLEQRAFVHPA